MFSQKFLSFSLENDNDKKKMDDVVNEHLDRGWYIEAVEVSNTAVVVVLCNDSSKCVR